MKLRIFTALCSAHLFLLAAVAQQDGIQSYTPATALRKGQWEIKSFQNLYTQIAGFDGRGQRQQLNSRSSYFTSIDYFDLGISERLSIGAELWFKSVKTSLPAHSALEVLQFGNDSSARTAITGFGPRLKYAFPSAQQPLALELSFLIPTAPHLEGDSRTPYLSEDSYLAILKAYRDIALSERFRLFSYLSAWLYADRQLRASSSYIATPLGVFGNYYPGERLTFYLQTEWWPVLGRGLISSHFLQGAAGLKFVLIKGHLEAELSHAIFILGQNTGAGRSYNLGLRFLH